MSKAKPDRAERVARKLVKIRPSHLGPTVFIGPCIFRDARQCQGVNPDIMRQLLVGDLAAALRKAGVNEP